MQPNAVYQTLHVIDAARDVGDEVVTEIELPEAAQARQRGWQRRQLVIGQTQDLRETESVQRRSVATHMS